MDYRGLVLIASGVALSVFGFQQSGDLGLEQPGTWLCIAGGAAPAGRCSSSSSCAPTSPLIQVRIFRIRAFAVENIVLGVSMMAFIPIFFFASEYAQISLGKSAPAGRPVPPLLLHRLRRRGPDRRADARPGGAKRPVVLGCALAAVGFFLWAGKVTELRLQRTSSGTSSWPAPAWA